MSANVVYARFTRPNQLALTGRGTRQPAAVQPRPNGADKMASFTPELRLDRTTDRPYNPDMHSVAETTIFSRRADALLSPTERMKLIGTLAADPQAGALIPGLGGIRKLRFAAGGKGKSGAFRVIYYVADTDWPILALLIYGKGEQENITPAQRDALLALLGAEKAKATTRRKAG